MTVMTAYCWMPTIRQYIQDKMNHNNKLIFILLLLLDKAFEHDDRFIFTKPTPFLLVSFLN